MEEFSQHALVDPFDSERFIPEESHISEETEARESVFTDDPVRAYGSMPGQLITVQDPDDPTVLLRFIPEPGNTGAYLLLAACPACSRLDRVRKVPTLSIACLADLGAGAASTDGGRRYEPDQVAVEFFDDLQHEPDCPLR